MIDWQTLVAATIVALSFAVLSRRLLAICAGVQQSGCGGSCSRCPNSGETAAGAANKLIQLSRQPATNVLNGRSAASTEENR